MLTHGPRGEYTRHRRHEECCRAVVALWRTGRLETRELRLFAYEDGGRAYLPRVCGDADRRRTLPERIWRSKLEIVTELYGFGPESWETRATPREEGFWCFSTPERSRQSGFQQRGSTMKVLVLYEYPPSPGGLATQGDLLLRGLRDLGVDAHACHFESPQEKEWYYRWFEPDVVVGVGFWGHTPHLVLHPQRYGVRPVPWLVADGYVAAYHEVLNQLPLILVTSTWVKETYRARRDRRGSHRGPPGGRRYGGVLPAAAR